jgi:hypothetical protein
VKHVSKGMVNVVDKEGKRQKVSMYDTRYLSG